MFSSLFRRSAPEQGAGPVTVNRAIKLRLLAWPTAPVSTAIILLSLYCLSYKQKGLTMRPCDCKDEYDVMDLKEHGLQFNENSIEVKPLVVVLRVGGCSMKMPQKAFEKLAKWYFEDQGTLYNQSLELTGDAGSFTDNN